MSEAFELGDEAAGVLDGVDAREVVAAGFAVGLAVGQHVPDGDDDRVFDGADCFLVAAADLESPVLR